MFREGLWAVVFALLLPPKVGRDLVLSKKNILSEKDKLQIGILN
jgi:hypothetical protein